MADFINKYGRIQNSPVFPNGEKEPYLVEEDTTNGKVYVCFDDGDNRLIKRITTTTSNNIKTTKIEIAYGSWTNRASLTYKPVNSSVQI